MPCSKVGAIERHCAPGKTRWVPTHLQVRHEIESHSMWGAVGLCGVLWTAQRVGCIGMGWAPSAQSMMAASARPIAEVTRREELTRADCQC